MTSILLGLFLLAAGIQLFYILAIFSRTAFHAGAEPTGPSGFSTHQPAVSIVICAWNERENLQELLPLLEQQDYPDFEILVMDDRSDDGSRELLEAWSAEQPHLRSIRINQAYEHVTPKKYALTTGIRQATHDIVLLTDADCRPVGPDWLVGMVSHLANPAKEIVLGFSPYERRPGWLNRLIRYETLFTAVQYFSLALAGRPYMGVGRNLMYRRALFIENKGFYSHIRVTGGDDDLFINEVATAENTAVSLDPATFMYSKPKETLADWRRQKRRHLSVGKHYKPVNKRWLGALSLSHILTWLLGLPQSLMALALFLKNDLTVLLQQPFGQAMLAGLAVFLLRLLLFWAIVGRISYRLDHTVHWASIPLMDVTLSGYYMIMGFVTLRPRRRPRKIRWR